MNELKILLPDVTLVSMLTPSDLHQLSHYMTNGINRIFNYGVKIELIAIREVQDLNYGHAPYISSKNDFDVSVDREVNNLTL